MLDQLLTIIAGNGILGMLLALFVYRDNQNAKELRAAHQARIQDAQNMTTVLMTQQARLLEVSERLERACDILSLERDRRR